MTAPRCPPSSARPHRGSLVGAPRLVCWSAAVLLAASAGHAGHPRLAEAEALVRQNEPAAAADVYRELLHGGMDTAGLRYNLGTLALQQGKVGEAVLHLRAASRLAPLDDDVRHNLSVALEARTDRLAGDPIVSPFAALGALTPPAVARVVLAIPLGLLGVALGLLGFVAGRARRVVWAGAAGLAVLCAVGGVVYGARRARELTREAVVLAESTPALREPGVSAPEAFVAHAGLFGDVIDELDGFVRVRFENGLEAWLQATALGFVDGDVGAARGVGHRGGS